MLFHTHTLTHCYLFPVTSCSKEERKQREKESGQLAATTGGSKSTGSSKQIRSQKNDYVKVNFGLDVGTLGIIFVDEQTTQRIAEFSVTGMNADVTVKENGAAKVLFELRSLAVQDLAAADSNRKGVDGTLAGTPNPLYERIVAPQDPSKVVVRAEVTTNLLLDDGWAGENEVGSSASLTLEPLCFVLMPSFIRELKNYFTRTIFFQALKKSEFLKMEKALVEREIDPTRKQSKSLFRVVIKAPKFILPKNYSSKDYLIVSFSAITAQNNYYLNSTASSSTTALPQPLPPASTISNCGCESGALNAISSSSSSSAINSSAISMACVASEFHVDGELLERTDVLFSGASAATSLGGAFCSITEGVSFDIGMTKSGNSQYNVFPVSCICLDFKPIALALSSEQFEFLVTFALNDIVVPNFDWVFFFLDFMELYGLSKPSKRQRIELAFSEISADFKKHYFDLPFARLVVRDLGVSVLGMLNGKLRTEFLINYLKLRAVKDEKSGYRMDDCIDLHNIVKVAVELEDVPATDPAFCNSGNNNCGNSSDDGGGSTTTDNNNTVSSGGASKESFLSNVVTIVTVEVEIVEVIVHILSLDFVSEFYLGFLVKNLALLHFDPNAASDLDGNGYRESSKAVVRVNASLKNSEIYAPTDEQQNVLMISGEVFTLEIDTARMYAVVKSKNSFAMINDKKVIEPFDCARFEFQFVDDVVLNVALDIGDLTGASPVGGLTLIASFIRFIFSLLLILFNPFSAHSPDEESDSDITFTCNIPRLKFFVTYDNDNSYESQFCLLRAAGSRVTIRDLVKSVGAPGSLEREVNTTFTVDFATEAQVDFFNQAFAWFEPILEPTRFQVNYDERDHVAPLKNNVVNRYAVAFSADSKMRLNVTIPFVRGIERIYLSLIGAELDPDVRDSFLLGSAGSSIGLNDNPYTKMLKAAAGKGGANAALAGEKLTEEEAFLLSSYEDIDHKKGESKTVILNKTGYPLAGYFFYEKILPEASAAAAAAASVVSFSTYSKGNASTLLRPSLSPSLSTSSSSSSSRLSRGSNDGNDSDDSEEDMTRREKFMIEPYTGWNPYFVSFGNNTRAKPFSLFRRQTNNILRVARMTFKGADLPSFNLCLDKAGTTLHRVPGIDPIVTEVKWVEEYKCKIVTIRSCLQIVNNTNYQLDAILTSSLHPELPPHVMKLKPDVVKSVPIGFSVESKVRIAIHKSQLYGQSLEAIRTSDILTGERFAYTCLPYDPSAPTPPLYFCAYGKKFAMNALTAVSSSSSSSSSSTGSPLSPSLSSPPNIPLNKQQHHHHHQQQQQQQQQQQPVPVQPSHPISEAASQYYQGLQQLGLSTRTFIGTIVIVPPIVVTNTIPHQCSFTASQLASGRAKKGVIRFVLEKGESTGLCNFDPRTAIALSITHIGSSTVSNIAFQAYTATQGTYLVEARTPNDALMPVQVSMVAKRIPVRTYTFGVPYWIVNKTGIKLSYGYNRMESISVALGDTEERPVIFSNDVLCIRTYSPQRQGKWTKDIPLKDPDPKDIELRSPDDTVQYAVRIVSVPGKKPYERSRVVTISPRYVFVNRIRGCVVSFKQSTLPDKAKVSLGYNEYKDYHWNAKAPSRSFVNFIKDSFDRSFLVSLRPAPGASTRSANTTNSSEEAAVTSVSVEYPWAGPFEIGACGEYTIRMVGPDSTDYFLRYEVVDAKYSTFVLFKEMKDIFVPYKIENSSGYQIYAYQEASSSEPLGQVVVDNNATRNFGWIRPLAKRVLAVRFPVSPPLVVRYNPNKVVRFEKIRIEGRPPIYNYMRVAGYTRVLVLTTDRAKYLAEGKFLGLDSGMFSGTASSFFNGRRIGSAAIIALPFLSDENAKKKKKELAASAYADGNEGSNRKRSSSRASTAGRELVSFSSDNADSGVEGDDGVVEDYDSMYAAALGNSCDVDGDNDGSNANESAPEGNCEDSDNDSNYGNGYITRLREEQEAEDAKREIRMRAKRPPPEGGRCEPDEICSVRIDVAVQSVEASIVTPEPRELAVLTLLGLSCKSEITASTLTTEVSVGYIQLDDQNFESVYPVPLVGLPAKETGHWMVAEVVRSRLHDAIDYYKYFSLSVAPLNVRLNVDFALRMYSYFCALEPEIFTMRKSSISSGGNGGSNSNKEGKEEDDDPKAKLTPWEAENENICKNRDVINDRMLYFQVFRLDPLKVYISLSSKWSSDADFLHNYLVEAALKLLENIENVPYDFNPVFFRNFFSAKSKFALVICYGYLTQILKHPGKLLGYSGSAGNASFIRETFGYGFEEVFRSTPTDADPEALESVRPCLYSQEGSSSATVAAADGAASAEPSSTPTSASSSFSALPALTEVSTEVRSRSSSAAVRPVRPFATAASMPSVWRLPLPDNLVRIPDKSLLVSRVHFYPRVFGMGGRLIRYQEVVFKLMYTIKELKNDVCVWNKVFSKTTTDSSTSTSEDEIASGPKRRKATLVCFITDKRFVFYEVGDKTRMDIISLDHATWALNKSTVYYIDEKDASVHTYDLLEPSVASEAFAVIKALNVAKLSKITPPGSPTSPIAGPYSQPSVSSSSVVSTIIAY